MSKYFYGEEADQFSFYRIPKLLILDPAYRSMNLEAKFLYGLFLDRMGLSIKNRWMDQEGKVFIIFTIEEIMEVMGCAEQKATKLLKELEKYELITRKRQGLGRPNLIFVKKIVCQDRRPDGEQEQFKNCEKHNSKTVITESQDLRKPQSNNTNTNDTDMNDSENPIGSIRNEAEIEEKDTIDGCDACDSLSSLSSMEREQYKLFFDDQIDVYGLINDMPKEKDTILGIRDMLVDTCCTKKKSVRVAGEDKSAEVVKSRLMKLNSEHIRYVLECMNNNTTNVNNTYQYMLTALYNAPVTMDSYYQAKVNYDLYGKRSRESLKPAFPDYDYDGEDTF